MMTDANIDATARGALAVLTDDEIDSVNGGIAPIIVGAAAAVGAWAAANSTFLVCAAAGGGLVLGFWYCATHYRNN